MSGGGEVFQRMLEAERQRSATASENNAPSGAAVRGLYDISFGNPNPTANIIKGMEEGGGVVGGFVKPLASLTNAFKSMEIANLKLAPGLEGLGLLSVMQTPVNTMTSSISKVGAGKGGGR